jgi:hypothetical protein
MNTPTELIQTLNAVLTTMEDAKARQREANRQYYMRNTQRRAEYHKAWYEANKDRLREHYRIKAQERRDALRNLNNNAMQTDGGWAAGGAGAAE